MKAIKLEQDQYIDLRNIGVGIYAPLTGFNNQNDFNSILDNMQLSDGSLWSIPIILDIDMKQVFADSGDRIPLEYKDKTVGYLTVDQIYPFNKERYCRSIFGTDDPKHPGVAHTLAMKDNLVSGDIELIEDIPHEFSHYNYTPDETKKLFSEKGWKTIVAFQTRNPVHRAHEYLQKCALETCDGLFINPVIGKKKAGDFTDKVIMKAYEKAIDSFYPDDRVALGILPMSMKYAGPKEAIHHAIIRQNFGCTHFIVGRDHAGVGDYYDSYAAHRIFDDIPEGKLKIQPIFFDHAFYCKECRSMATDKTCPHDEEHKIKPAGKKIRALFTDGTEPDEDMMRTPYYVSEVVDSYRKAIDSYYNGNFEISKDMISKLESAFSREFTSGWFNEEAVFNRSKATGVSKGKKEFYEVDVKDVKIGRKKVDLNLPKINKKESEKKLLVRVYNARDALAACDNGADVVYYDIFADDFNSINVKCKLFGVVPRIVLDNDIDEILSRIKKLKLDGILTGNLGIIGKIDVPIHLDYNLNCFNDYVVDYFNKLGCFPIISPELSITEVNKFKDKSFSVMVHGKVRLMTLRHDLDKERIVDEKGGEFIINKIRNGSEVLNRKEIGLLGKITGLDINSYYIDTDRAVGKIVRLYRKILDGEKINDSKLKKNYVLGWSFNGVE